jgi:hypothetical protein
MKDIWPKIGKTCARRMKVKGLTSNQFMMILECKKDLMNIEAFNLKVQKEDVATLAVIVDLACTVLMLFVLYRMDSLNT